MSIIPRLLAGEATEAVDLAAVKTFLGGGKKARRQVQNFANSARRSDIGGDAGFEQMTVAQQREFISGSNTHVARKIRSHKDVTSYQRPAHVPEPTTIPRLLLGDRVGGAVDATVNAGRAVRQGVSNLGGALNEGGGIIFDAVKQDLKSGVKGAVDFASHAGERLGGAARGGLEVIEDAAAELGDPTTGVQGMVGRLVTERPDATRSAAANVREAGSNTLNAVGNNPVMRFLAGDTSGRAASNASTVFQRNYEDVFSSQATAEAFGVEGGLLKQAFSQSGDDFTATLRRGGLKDDAIEGLEAFRSEVRKVADEGGNLSSEGMQAMLKNQAEVGNMYAGFSRAGATASPNALLRGMAGEGTGMESIMGIAAVAGLAGGANVMMGGEFTEGAAVGGIGALSVRGIAKGVAGSMGDIENAMMKSILGDDMVTAGTKESSEKIMSGTALGDIPTAYQSTSKVGDFIPGLDQMATTKPLHDMSISDYLKTNSNAAKVTATQDVTVSATEKVTGGQARRQNLQAIQELGDDAEQLQGFGKKKMRDLLNPNKERNVAMNNRALVLGGGMLSGIAFTGNADRRDYRRGFNAHRGNRI